MPLQKMFYYIAHTHTTYNVNVTYTYKQYIVNNIYLNTIVTSSKLQSDCYPMIVRTPEMQSSSTIFFYFRNVVEQTMKGKKFVT